MDIETRVALLERENERRHRDNLELRETMNELTEAVRELNKWQASMKYPMTALGFFFIGILSAAGYGVWSLLTSNSG